MFECMHIALASPVRSSRSPSPSSPSPCHVKPATPTCSEWDWTSAVESCACACAVSNSPRPPPPPLQFCRVCRVCPFTRCGHWYRTPVLSAVSCIAQDRAPCRHHHHRPSLIAHRRPCSHPAFPRISLIKVHRARSLSLSLQHLEFPGYWILDAAGKGTVGEGTGTLA
ncbi:hypothetical protein K466DRAFT_64629 [Polyporus arcularius HHB13444]|uniref:Uncharacterized protein n=1 Tax=Polyporus arcularius HHB13444 TaxID=1314778 RepID=A0A5C3PJV5_9APHY|nr:hypothetical protein K466DRAFT_64629 [Polyporus arcularius HHB13444]